MHTDNIARIWLACAALFALSAAPAVQAMTLAALPASTLVATLGLGIVLSILSAIDIATLRLPDYLTLPLIAAGLIVSYLVGLDDVWWRLAAGVSAFLLLYAIAEIFRRLRGVDALGLGDAKLFAAAGTWVGFDGLPSVLLLSSVAALIAAAIAMAGGASIDRSTRIPFGPFLAGGFWLTWLYGPNLLL